MHAKIQFAGSIGMFSAGAGYRLNKTDIDLYAGYLPQKDNRSIVTLTAKLVQSIGSIELRPDWTIIPLQAGTYISYSFGKEFTTDLPEWYPEGYYWWTESLRLNIFIGSTITHRFSADKKFSGLGFYYEVGTNELKLISFMKNSTTLSLRDTLHASLGVKVIF